MRTAASAASGGRRGHGAGSTAPAALPAAAAKALSSDRVLALQRLAGNRATAEVAHRGELREPVRRLGVRRRMAARRVLARERLPYEHQWENPALLETIYPGRELMLKAFVTMYREIELGDLTEPADRQKVIDKTRAAMEKRLEQLKASAAPSKQDANTIKAIERALKAGAKSHQEAWEQAVRWERDHYADPLAGETLMAEVKRLFGTSAVPEWLQPLVLDYAGMRYKSAHGSYYNPVRLLYLYERERGTWATAREQESAAAQKAYEEQLKSWEEGDKKKRGKKPAKPKAVKEAAAERKMLGMSLEEALKELERLHDAGEIPAWAWHKIVRLTELRTWYATKGWEDESKEKPDPADTTPASKRWSAVLAAWTGKERVGKLPYHSTGWREEMYSRNAVITTRMVCNELSEASQRQRGVTLKGGISANARQYADAVAKGAEPGAPKELAGAYLKRPTSLDDLRPGASLFWTHSGEWGTKYEGHATVHHIAGGKYPMPPPPEYVSAWKDWEKANKQYLKDKKAYELKVKKAKSDEERAALGEAPKPSSPEPAYGEPDEVPADGAEVGGWTYSVKLGQPVTRTKGEVTHYLKWRHQGTVLRAMPDGRVFVWETTDAMPGPEKLSVSGFRVRRLTDLNKPGVFVGYMPGAVGEPGPAAAPASTPAASEPVPAGEPAPAGGPTGNPAPQPLQLPIFLPGPVPIPVPIPFPLCPSGATLSRVADGRAPIGGGEGGRGLRGLRPGGPGTARPAGGAAVAGRALLRDYESERRHPGSTSRHCAVPVYAPFELHFDGNQLRMAGGGADASWAAVSGRPSAGSYDYSFAAQRVRNKGPIPEGVYWIDPRELVNLEDRWFYGWRYERAWGTHRITIHPYPDTVTHGRGGFFIHGGTEAGSAGCIDLTTRMKSFAKRLVAETPRGTFVKLRVRYARVPVRTSADERRVPVAAGGS